jgi:hypothetical protein
MEWGSNVSEPAHKTTTDLFSLAQGDAYWQQEYKTAEKISFRVFQNRIPGAAENSYLLSGRLCRLS